MRRFRIKVSGKVYDVEVEEIEEAKGEKTPQHAPVQQQVTPLLQQKRSGVYAPMAGKILEIKKNVGEDVGAGDVLLVMESMKMEVYVRSENNGVVKRMHVATGQTVDSNTLLAEVE